MDPPAQQAPVVELSVAASGPERHREPVTCGVPWPRGLLHDPARLYLSGPDGRACPLQVRALDRWPDGSVRWALLDWQADVRGSAVYRLGVAEDLAAKAEGPRLRAETGPGEIRIDTGAAHFRMRTGGSFPFTSVVVSGVDAIDAARTRFAVEDEAGRVYRPSIRRLEIEESGPLRTVVVAEGETACPARSPCCT